MIHPRFCNVFTRLTGILLGMAVMFAIGGCGSTLYRISKLSETPPKSITAVDQVGVHRAGEPIALPYEVVGHVYTYRGGAWKFEVPREERLAKTLQKLAASLGGEGMVGLHSDNFNGEEHHKNFRWASGLAVRFTGASPGPHRIPFITAIPPVWIAPALGKMQKQHRDLDTWARDAAQFVMERKGYCVFRTIVNTCFGTS